MKLQKRYLVFIFVFALAIGIFIRDINTSKFAVIKNSQALAPESVITEIEEDTQSDGGLININTASKASLMELDGIGEALAKRIIEYRQEHGKFEVIYDIMKVSGIGQNKFDDIKDYITVE